MAPRLKYKQLPYPIINPAITSAGVTVTRPWRCGNRGNVASVLIEKPACGDFLPLVDGGYSLQYSPLMEYREGQGMVLFCQMDVTGRTEADPAAERLARNLLSYTSAWKPAARRTILYAGDPAGQKHLQQAGFAVEPYAAGALKADRVLVVSPGGGAPWPRTRTPLRRGSNKTGACWPWGWTPRKRASFCRSRWKPSRPSTLPRTSNLRRPIRRWPASARRMSTTAIRGTSRWSPAAPRRWATACWPLPWRAAWSSARLRLGNSISSSRIPSALSAGPVAFFRGCWAIWASMGRHRFWSVSRHRSN